MYHTSFQSKKPQQPKPPIRNRTLGGPRSKTRGNHLHEGGCRWKCAGSCCQRRSCHCPAYPVRIMPLFLPSAPMLSSSPPPHSTYLQGRGGDLHWFCRSAMLLLSSFWRSDHWQVDQLRHGSVWTHACRIRQGVRWFSAAVLSSDMHYTHTHVNDNSFWYQSKQK